MFNRKAGPEYPTTATAAAQQEDGSVHLQGNEYIRNMIYRRNNSKSSKDARVPDNDNSEFMFDQR